MYQRGFSNFISYTEAEIVNVDRSTFYRQKNTDVQNDKYCAENYNK